MSIYGLTPLGEKHYRLAEKYGLDVYFQLHVGNLIIPENEFYSVSDKVLEFIRDNDWILGYEEDYYYLMDVNTFKNW